MQRTLLLWLGIVLAVLGLFLFSIAFSTYSNENSTYQNCLSRTGFDAQYCNSQVPVASWTIPLSIVGGVLAAIGAGLVILPFLRLVEGKTITPSS